MLRLFYSQNSPYARIARIGVIACGLTDRIEQIRVVNRTPDNPLLDYSPVCRVPTLVHDGLVICETRNVCAYLEHLAGAHAAPLLADAERDGWPAVALEGLATGFLDGVAVWTRENRRGEHERSPGVIDQERQRAERCLAYFESVAGTSSLPSTFAGLSIAAALGGMDFNGLCDDWRRERPALAGWYDEIAGQPPMQATRPAK